MSGKDKKGRVFDEFKDAELAKLMFAEAEKIRSGEESGLTRFFGASLLEALGRILVNNGK